MCPQNSPRTPPELGFDCGYQNLDTSYAIRVPHLSDTYLTALPRPFPEGSGPQLFTEASPGGLEPASSEVEMAPRLPGPALIY